MSNVVLVTGGFDPIHKGHIEYFKEAKLLGDKLIVGIKLRPLADTEEG